MFGLLTIFAVIEFVIAIWISALCCGAVCRCCKSQVRPTVSEINDLLKAPDMYAWFIQPLLVELQ